MQILIVTQLQIKGFAFTNQCAYYKKFTTQSRCTRIEENPTLKIEDVRYKTHCWTVANVLKA